MKTAAGKVAARALLVVTVGVCPVVSPGQPGLGGFGSSTSARQAVSGERSRPGQQLPPLPVIQLEEGRREPGEQTFSLTFAEPIPIIELLLLLVRDTGVSLVPDPDVQGTFVGELRDVTLRQALDLILQPLGLEYTLQNNVLRVFPRQLHTRIFSINYVGTRRSATRTMGASTSLGSAVFGAMAPETAVVPPVGAPPGSATGVTSADSGDVFDDIVAGLRTLLSADGRFNLDRKAGLLQVVDYAGRLDRVGLYLEAVQTRVNRQVQISARVIEVTLAARFAAGIDWGLVLERAGDAVVLTQRLAPAGGMVTMGLDIRDFGAFITALASQGTVNVLSSPRVVAMNNEPAVMRVGTQDVFFVTLSQVDALSGRVLQTLVAPQAITEGVVLSVTPQISGDGIISMSVMPSVTARTGEATSRFGDTVPVLSVRETDTFVRVAEGQTIVIAGLMQERMDLERSKVPLLGDVPLFGGLFRREERIARKLDLVVLLTPVVMTPAAIAVEAARELDRLGEAQEMRRE
jgi:MSHA biogenesis protein MshL